jgi:hypothetical protein
VSSELPIQLALGAFGVGLVVLPIVLWVRSLRRRGGVMTLPPGFMDDMRIALPEGLTHEKLAAFVIENALRSVPDDETERQLVQEYSLSSDDAAHVRDRVFGGVFRAVLALAGNKHNDPSVEKDPLAFAGFKRVMSQPEIARRIYPQFAAARPAE